jgi:hypothetical protein
MLKTRPTFSLILFTTIIFALPVGTEAQTSTASDQKFSIFHWDIRSLLVLGFFPQGGNVCIPDNAIFNTYIFGSGLDFCNFKLGEGRVSPLNFSAYLIGINYNKAFNPKGESQLINPGYFRLGPHCRFKDLRVGNFAFGAGLGYGVVLIGRSEEGRTVGQHGLDVSFTFSWISLIGDH